MSQPPLPDRRSLGSRSAGFTLIELLVVIGIIVVLMGILIPVAAHVRKSAYVASTQSQLLVIQSGIEAYRQVFESYPGPLADSQVQGGTAPLMLTDAGGPGVKAVITGTENLALGILGGLTPVVPATVPPTFKFDPTLVGGGPSSLNPLKAQRYQSFVDPVAAGLDTVKAGRAWLPWTNPAHENISNQASSYKDTVVPEFVDRFPDTLPILYIRARVGATNVVPGFPVAGAAAAYDPAQLYPYPFAIVVVNPNGVKPTPSDFPTAQSYFGSLANFNVPRQKDGFMLISAGADRIYGTADDLTNTGRLK